MDKKYVDDNNIKRKYLRGLLAEDELVKFEIYLMDNPELVEELELEELLYRAMPQLENSQTSQQSWNWGFLDIPLRRVFAPIIVCLFVIPLGLISLLREPGLSTIQPVFLTSDNYRAASGGGGAAEATTLSFQDDGQIILLMLYPENEVADSFDVAIRDLSGSLNRQAVGLSRGDSGYISVELSAATIGEGGYLLEITPRYDVAQTSSENIESIPFRVVKTN